MEHTLCFRWPCAGNAFMESAGFRVKRGAFPRHFSHHSPQYLSVSVALSPENSRITRS